MNNSDPRDINAQDFTECVTQEEKILFFLRYAILSPSTHNSQPWLFKIEDSVCKIYLDQKYRLPEADPHGRDAFISIGCCVENLILSAKYFNCFDKVELGVFNNEQNLLAKVHFKNTQNVVNDDYKKYILAIPKRINARGFFKNEPVSQDLLNSIILSVGEEGYLDGLKTSFIDKKEDIVRVADLTAKGIKYAYLRKSFRKEMYKWMNNSLSNKKEGMPGYALKIPFIASFFLPTLVRFFDIGKILAKLNYRSLSSVPLVTVVSSKENSPIIWLKTGRLVERLMLDFNIANFNTSVFSASIEMGDFYKDIQQILNTQDIPQFLFVVGKVDSLHKPTPRHSLTKKIIK